MNYLRVLLLILLPLSSFSQVDGTWHGMLNLGAQQLPIIIHVNSDEQQLILDSPDQMAMGKEADSVVITDSTIFFKIITWNVIYNGTYNPSANKIEGVFKQVGEKMDLNFQRTEVKKKEIKRPQNPPENVDYEIVEVRFKNKKGKLYLSGTLTIPKGEGPFPAVVLASGTGQQDRNEEMVKHKPFHVIAHHLTSNGIMVLRFDDRFYGESQPKFYNSSMEDFASDVNSAINFLSKNKQVDKDKLGVVGHSEGGIHGPIAASQNKRIRYIVSLAGVGVKGTDLLIRQRQMLLKEEGITMKSILIKDSLMMNEMYAKLFSEEGLNMRNSKEIIEAFFENLTDEELAFYADAEDAVKTQIPRFFSVFAIQSFLKYDPKPYWEKIDVPLLALNGSKDIQVEAEQNINGFKKLSKHPESEFVVFDGLNHLFQKCMSCKIAEYGALETTIEMEVLEKVVDWITKR